MAIVLMGVSGSGKSTVGRALADVLGCDFQEGDDLHPQANIDKMSAGIPLNDNDRQPWLQRIERWISDENAQARHGVVTCSALKRSYRDQLRRAGGDVRFVYLRLSRAELGRRMQHRRHFMPAALLDSQLQVLEEPSADEDVLTVSARESVDEIIVQVRQWLRSAR
jgi:gluconokinase